MYLGIKKVVETEEDFTVTKVSGGWDIGRIQKALLDGDLNIVQVACVEPIAWLVDKNGKRIAVLEKEGGWGPSEETTIETGAGARLDFQEG